MAPPSKPRASYQDLLAVPEHLIAEIVDGDLYTSPRPAPRHARANTALGAALHGPFDAGRGGPGGWTILFEPELHLADDVVVPDLAGWRRERMPRLPETAYFPLAPDWICEVLSPSTVALDRVTKLALYAREGVRHAWLVDPVARTVEVLRCAMNFLPFEPSLPPSGRRSDPSTKRLSGSFDRRSAVATKRPGAPCACCLRNMSVG